MTRKKKTPISISESTAGDPIINSDWIRYSPRYLRYELKAHEEGMKIYQARLKAKKKAAKAKRGRK